jgi:steroid 5-alpha reductase family enzyme
VIATVVVFVFSRAYRNSTFYDAYWSVAPPLMLFYRWSQAGPDVDLLRCWLVAIVVVYWAVRLTGNWVYPFPGLHH